jgi:hypothetical protein
VRRGMKGALGLGLLGGLAFAAWRTFVARAAERPKGVEWESAPFPFPPVPRPTGASASPPATSTAPRATNSANGSQAWTEPNADGSCPATHPVKAKLSSGIFHVPGGLNYERTNPDRCYLDEATAVADGLRPSKV